MAACWHDKALRERRASRLAWGRDNPPALGYHVDTGQFFYKGYAEGVDDTNKLAREWIVKLGLVAFLGGIIAGILIERSLLS